MSAARRRTLFWAAAIVVVAGWLASTGRQGRQAGPGVRGVRVYLHQRPTDLNPHTWGYAAESLVTGYIFDHLMERDPDDPGVYHPALAAACEKSIDRQVLTFHLRRGVRWHDGRPFSARDVKFTFDFVRREGSTSPLRSRLAAVTCEVVDPCTVRFHARRPTGRTFETLVERGFSILPWHRLAGATPAKLAAFGRHPVGTGPYAFARWEHNRIHLVRHPGYWGPAPAIEGIVFKVYTDPVAAFADLRNGRLDFFPRVRPDTLFDRLLDGRWTAARLGAAMEAGGGVAMLPADANPRLRLGCFATTRVSFIAWNLRRPPLDERAVRVAMAHLLDRRSLERGPSRGLGRPVTGDQVWFGPAYDPDVRPFPFDPGRARALLESAGWFDRDGDGFLDRGGRRLHLEIVYPAPASAALLHELGRAARGAGVEVELVPLERGRFTRAKEERDFDGLYLAWVLDVEEDPYPVWHSRFAAPGAAGANLSGFAGADELVEQAHAALDPEVRWARLRRLQRIIHHAQPVLFIQAETMIAAWDPRLRGVRFHPRKPPGWDLREWRLAAEP